jgi:crotonobetainyl-CoA:carnitine CoA-transferase CaiB-like acyl-CoA transferase
MSLPLSGVKVLDFSTLLPGPLAALILAEAGAEVIKIERPGGEDLRRYPPYLEGDGVNFWLLNRGKQAVAVDLKSEAGRAALRPYLESADVLIDQFRPGVMDRLGLGYDAIRAINPGILYCSITGYGQSGERRHKAGHDLNYMAETGLLSLTDPPALPPVLAGDIGGGTFPAVINILLALMKRAKDGVGEHLDISMADNLFTLAYWGLGMGWSGGAWPKPGGELVTGGSPRYGIYKTQDGKHLACAPIEEVFWKAFTDTIGLPPALRGADCDPAQVIRAVSDIIASRTSAQWMEAFAGLDVCVTPVVSLEEAASDPAFAQRGLWGRRVEANGHGLPALPVPLADALRRPETVLSYARLKEPQA